MARRFPTLASFALLALLPATAAAQVSIEARGAAIRVGGRVQAQLAHSSVGLGPGLNLLVRRARLTVDVELNEWVGGRIQPSFVGGLKDAYVRFAFGPSLRLSMGQFKRAFDPFQLHSSTLTTVIERDGGIPGLDVCAGIGGICSLSAFTEGLGYADRDVGVRADGRLTPRLAYQATLTNGAGSNTDDANDAVSGAGRFVYAVTDRVRLGANLSVHDYLGPGGTTELASAWGADLEVGEFETPGVHFQAGLVGGDNWLNAGVDGEPSSFLTAQWILSYYRPTESTGPVIAVEPLGRMSWGDPDRDTDEDGGLLLTPGVMLFFSERNKIAANVDVHTPQDGPTEWSLKVQSYLYF